MTLTEALAERVGALARTRERLQALDDATAAHVVHEPDGDAVLTQARAALSSPGGLDAARRLVRGDAVTVPREMASAGLAAWDPATDSMRPTALLVELLKVVDP